MACIGPQDWTSWNPGTTSRRQPRGVIRDRTIRLTPTHRDDQHLVGSSFLGIALPSRYLRPTNRSLPLPLQLLSLVEESLLQAFLQVLPGDKILELHLFLEDFASGSETSVIFVIL